jgi:hypothetical protein
MTDAEYWNEEAQYHADTIREDTSRAPFGAYSVPTNPGVAVLYGKGSAPFKDDEVARKAVNVLCERFNRLAVRELADALDSEDGSTWTIIVQSPNRPIEEKIDQLSDEVERAYRIVREQE